MKLRSGIAASLLLLSLTVSCSIATTRTISLDNKIIQSFSSFSSIGYGSVANLTAEQNQKKEKKANRNIKQMRSEDQLGTGTRFISSSTPFTLIGQEKGKLSNLTVQNDNADINIEISGYCDLPGFIAFSYGNNYENQEYKLTLVNDSYNGPVMSPWDLTNFSNVYLLSKKSGKIYDFSKAKEELNLVSSFIGGSDALYVRPNEYDKSEKDKNTGFLQLDCNYYRITEENDSLVFSKSFSFKVFQSFNPILTDKYGNFMTYEGTNIITTSGTLLDKSSLPEGLSSFHHDNYLNLFYAQAGNDYYYLDATSSLIKNDGPIGYQRKDTDTDEDEGLANKINDTFYPCTKFYSFENTDYYFNEYSNFVVSYTKLSELAYNFAIVFEPNADCFLKDGRLYYCAPSSNSIYEYDVVTNTNKELKVDGYQISSIDMDDYGNITVSGYDSSLNSFSGYLTKDNQVVLEPILTDGYLTYSLTPLN